MTPSSDSSDMYTSTVQSGPPLLMLHSHPTLVSKPLIPHLSILYLLPLPPHHRPLLLIVVLRLLPPLPPHSLRVLQWNAGGIRARSTELLHFLLSHLVDLICIQESNLNSSSSFRIPEFSALCSDCTHSRSGILSFDATHASGGVVILSGRAYPFLHFLPPLCLRSIPTLIVWGSTSLLTTPPRSLFLMCTLPLFSPPQRMAEPIPFLPILPSSRNLFILGDFNCHHPFWDSRGTSDPRGEEVFNWVISSDLLPLNDPDTPTLLHRSSPDISFAPPSLALSCSWEVLQDLGSDHLPILLFVSISPVLRPNERPPSFNFQKACWNGFASYFDSHCPSAEEYSSLSLSSAVALFSPLALNAAKSSISFGRIKPSFSLQALLKPGGLLRWKKRLVKNARFLLPLTEKMKIARLTFSLLDVPRQSSPRPRLRHGRRLGFLFHPNLTLNLYTLFFALSLAPGLPPWPSAMPPSLGRGGVTNNNNNNMVRAMCGQKVVDRKTTEEQMDMLGLQEAIDWLATANRVRWFGHVLRRDDDSVLRVAINFWSDWQEKARTTERDLEKASGGGDREDWFEEGG